MSVSLACKYALTALQQELTACGQMPSKTSIAECNCNLPDPGSVNAYYTESLLAYCDLPGNEKASWYNDYQSGVSARANSCANVGLTVQPVPIEPLPNYIPNPIKDSPTPILLTAACLYVLDAFNNTYQDCQNNGDVSVQNTCICNGLFTESLLAYCELPGNDKGRWFFRYEETLAARSNSCAKVGLSLTPLPLLTLPDNIPNPLAVTSATTLTSVVDPTSIPPTQQTTSTNSSVATTITSLKPTTAIGSGAHSTGFAGALVLACAVL
ncbi:hypothetical protein HDU79_001068, partial [Rhizoclosmatium sp. JEL0117]